MPRTPSTPRSSSIVLRHLGLALALWAAACGKTPQTQPPTTWDDPDSGDRSNEALGWINDAMVACDPTTGEYVTDMSAWGSGTSYTVTVTISLDSGSWVATFYVDFATEDWPEITPADSESAALICQ